MTLNRYEFIPRGLLRAIIGSRLIFTVRGVDSEIAFAVRESYNERMQEETWSARILVVPF